MVQTQPQRFISALPFLAVILGIDALLIIFRQAYLVALMTPPLVLVVRYIRTGDVGRPGNRRQSDHNRSWVPGVALVLLSVCLIGFGLVRDASPVLLVGVMLLLTGMVCLGAVLDPRLDD